MCFLDVHDAAAAAATRSAHTDEDVTPDKDREKKK